MTSAVAELEAGLLGMLNLKPPGVSGSRITALNELCVRHVQSESVLIQKLYTHFKKAPATHKLGVLYVVDSVTRKWMDMAKAEGQAISQAARDGTPAAGVHKVTDLMPTLMNDIIATAPEDHKEKIRKLIDIWEKAQTFPSSMLNSFKSRLVAPRPNVSTTPPGSPPPNLLASLGVGSKPAAPQPPAMPNILETLANIARQNATVAQSTPSLPAPAPVSAPSSIPAPTYSNASMPYASASAQPSMPYPPTSQPAHQPVNYGGVPPAYPPVQPAAPAVGLGVAGSQANAFAPNNPTVQMVATLAAQGLTLEQIASVIQLLGQGGAAPAAQPPVQMPQPAQSGYAAAPPNAPAGPGPSPWDMPRPDASRDRNDRGGNGYHDGSRSPGRPRGRSRSRSPPRGWDARNSPRTRGNDRGFNDYGRPPSPGRDQDRDRRGGRMPEYRQRSPPGRRAQSTPDRDPSDKWVEIDKSVPEGNIKVYSRTLFVGGVTCPEAELRQLFSRYGRVQTCIVNKDKRHAFVKMFLRKDAEAAKVAMEDQSRTNDMQLRTRWGVGFGPRDCSDYQTGVSIIPIHKLTEADRKWMLTAPFGGSGGRPIVSGLTVEEPDIEIGAGVSSKAISRRMQTDKGGNHGPKSSRHNEGFEHMHTNGGMGGVEPPRGGGDPRGGGADMRGGRWRHAREKHRNSGGGDHRRDDRHGGNDEPVVPGLPAGITVGPNGINYPPNFNFGA
ncbi:Rpb7-binding protein seb1 [Podospora conica]|nr:Rpb7-binding protein seb1 [Schizothecium conicum]